MNTQTEVQSQGARKGLPEPADPFVPAPRTETQSSLKQPDAEQAMPAHQPWSVIPSATRRVRAGGPEFRALYKHLRACPAWTPPSESPPAEAEQNPLAGCPEYSALFLSGVPHLRREAPIIWPAWDAIKHQSAPPRADSDPFPFFPRRRRMRR